MATPSKMAIETSWVGGRGREKCNGIRERKRHRSRGGRAVSSRNQTVPTTFRSVPGNSRPPTNQNAGFSLSIFSSAPPSVRTNAFHFSLPLEFFLCFLLILKHVHAHPSFLYFHSIFFTVLRQLTWIKTVSKKKKEKKTYRLPNFFSPDHQPYIVISFAFFFPPPFVVMVYRISNTVSREMLCKWSHKKYIFMR